MSTLISYHFKSSIITIAKKGIRSFYKGYLTISCDLNGIMEQNSHLVAMQEYIPELEFSSKVYQQDSMSCAFTMKDPVLIVSHDSVFNLGHLFEDVLNWWMVAKLNKLETKSLAVLNIDGLRPTTIHMGRGRFFNMPPDTLGPFADIFKVLFKEAYSLAGNFTQDKGYICFEQGAYLMPSPVKAFLWEKFEVADPCSKKLRVRFFI
jgi:hypothetical protein